MCASDLSCVCHPGWSGDACDSQLLCPGNPNPNPNPNPDPDPNPNPNPDPNPNPNPDQVEFTLHVKCEEDTRSVTSAGARLLRDCCEMHARLHARLLPPSHATRLPP